MDDRSSTNRGRNKAGEGGVRANKIHNLMGYSTMLKTAAEWARLPEGYKYQLIAGEFVEWSSMTLQEHDLRMEIGLPLYNHVKLHKLGEALFVPLDVRLTEYDIYQPDIFFVSSEHIERLEEDGVHGAPDLVIEILSASTAHYDKHRKKDIYETSGVMELWIVDPLHLTVECFRNSANGYENTFSGKIGIVCSLVLPEFCVDVEALFAR